MTVESTAFYTDWYLANGANKIWNYDFAILAESNITILVRDGTDDSTSVKYTNGFSFNPNSDYSAGTITFPATGDALAAGKQLRIVRSMDFLQTTEIGMEGNFSPILHERAFDKLTMQTQELKEGAERAIKVPLGFSGYELSSTFADYTTFMKLGEFIVPGPTAAQIQQAETNAEEAIAAKDAAETARDLAAGYAASINPTNFYTKIQIDDFRTADQTSAKNAGNLNAGIIPDARLPARLYEYPAEYADDLGIIADYDLATKCGNYYAPATAAHLPTVGVACIVGVSAATAMTVRQDAFEASTQRHWCRYGYDNSGVIVWTGWEPVYEAEAELQPLIDARIAANAAPKGSSGILNLAGVSTGLITGIPAGVSKVSVALAPLLAGSSYNSVGIRLGTESGMVSTGYAGGYSAQSSGVNDIETFDMTDAFVTASTANVYSGIVEFRRFAANKWVWSSCGAFKSGTAIYSSSSSGSVDLGEELTQLQIRMYGGAAFSSGSMKLFWE